ncbi:MAG: RNA-binding protein, partial [Spirochaetaceae bacterium]
MKKNNIFVGNLAFSTTREEVMAICQTHGTVVSIRMRKNSGYALVEMAGAEQAQAVIDN